MLNLRVTHWKIQFDSKTPAVQESDPGESTHRPSRANIAGAHSRTELTLHTRSTNAHSNHSAASSGKSDQHHRPAWRTCLQWILNHLPEILLHPTHLGSVTKGTQIGSNLNGLKYNYKGAAGFGLSSAEPPFRMPLNPKDCSHRRLPVDSSACT